MKLAAVLGTQAAVFPEFAEALERAGYDSIWSAEDWGKDAVSQLAWVGSHTSRISLGTSILQIPARSPAATAMTAASMANLSKGRFILGIGPSGPQVAEGWHGVAYGKPLTKLREYVSIVRQALERNAPLEVSGEYYELPYNGDDATGLGKPLRMNTKPKFDVPIYTSAMGPKALELGGEIADGVIATLVDPTRLEDVEQAIGRGLQTSGRSRSDFTLIVHSAVVVGDDVKACLDGIRPGFARTIGGYGAKSKNFYFNQVSRAGWGDAAERVQELYLAGRRDEAAAAIPDEMLETYCLVGPPERIAKQIDRFEGCDVMMLGTPDLGALTAIAAARG